MTRRSWTTMYLDTKPIFRSTQNKPGPFHGLWHCFLWTLVLACCMEAWCALTATWIHDSLAMGFIYRLRHTLILPISKYGLLIERIFQHDGLVHIRFIIMLQSVIFQGGPLSHTFVPLIQKHYDALRLQGIPHVWATEWRLCSAGVYVLPLYVAAIVPANGGHTDSRSSPLPFGEYTGFT